MQQSGFGSSEEKTVSHAKAAKGERMYSVSRGNAKGALFCLDIILPPIENELVVR
jgi:hypothetical protein